MTTTVPDQHQQLEGFIKDEVLRMYDEVAHHPENEFHFFHGRRAAEMFDYEDDWLDSCPEGALASFAGVGNPHLRSQLAEGEAVLDLGSGARSTDLCARIGGEEFAILMPATELEGSLQVAVAIQEELAKANIPHENSDRGYLTVSIGLNVQLPDRTSSLEDLMREADKALYAAKDAGRDAIRIAESLEQAPAVQQLFE